MAGDWRQGWIPMADERGPDVGFRLHRPLTGFPGYTQCGRLVDTPSALQRRKPSGIPECSACAQAETCNDGADATRKGRADEMADRADRRRARGTSVRAASGGLPSLGKKQ